MFPQSTITIDQILDELDKLARSPIPDDEFYRRLMLYMSGLVGTTTNAILVPAIDNQWVIRYSVGAINETLVDSVREVSNEPTRTKQTWACLSGVDSALAWYALAISPTSMSLGLLVSIYPSALSEAERNGLREIQQAFCELINERQSIAFQRFLANDLSMIREMGRYFETNDSVTMDVRTLVNGLAAMVPHCRVSLCEAHSSDVCQPIAVSAVSAIDKKSPDYLKIKSLAEQALKKRGACASRNVGDENNSWASSDCNKYDTLFLPFGEQSKVTRWILGFEFVDHAAYVSGCSKLPYVLPIIETVWKQKLRWLSTPAWLRRIPFSSSGWRSSAVRLRKIATLGFLFVAFSVWMLMPTSLWIEAQGTLMPIESKAIFASADGFISTLLISDNQSVEAGQLLVTMTSPEIELQLEDLRGKMRGIEEESRGLEIAMNQLQLNTDDAMKQQSFMASKQKDLSIQLDSIRTQIAIVEDQRAMLDIRSPISGIAIGKDLQQNLHGRPVNRGELLFRIIDANSDWELRLNVTDYDSDYVRTAYHNQGSRDHSSITFILDSSPNERRQASIKTISNRVENVYREGNFLEVRADGFVLENQYKKVGSNVHAYFLCGQRTTLFVWFRPLIEAARRKLWF